MLNAFLAHMRAAGWEVQRNSAPGSGLPEPVKSRYSGLPNDWLEFIAAVRRLTSGSGQTWFLCADDYGAQGDAAFSWNEWEQLSLESAEDDPAWGRDIVRFWDRHLPILLSVSGGYSYYAISVEDGSVVHGREPEFEECSFAAASFTAFMEGVLQGRIEL